MAQLRELIAGVEGARVLRGVATRPVRELRDDSRQVGPGDLFVAVPGTRSDGRAFIAQALAQGAAAVVTEGEPDAAQAAALGGGDGAWVAVPSARHALALIAANHFAAGRELTL